MRGDVESFGRFFPGTVREVVPQNVQQIYKRAKKLRRKCTLHFLPISRCAGRGTETLFGLYQQAVSKQARHLKASSCAPFRAQHNTTPQTVRVESKSHLPTNTPFIQRPFINAAQTGESIIGHSIRAQLFSDPEPNRRVCADSPGSNASHTIPRAGQGIGPSARIRNETQLLRRRVELLYGEKLVRRDLGNGVGPERVATDNDLLDLPWVSLIDIKTQPSLNCSVHGRFRIVSLSGKLPPRGTEVGIGKRPSVKPLQEHVLPSHRPRPRTRRQTSPSSCPTCNATALYMSPMRVWHRAQHEDHRTLS